MGLRCFSLRTALEKNEILSLTSTLSIELLNRRASLSPLNALATYTKGKWVVLVFSREKHNHFSSWDGFRLQHLSSAALNEGIRRAFKERTGARCYFLPSVFFHSSLCGLTGWVPHCVSHWRPGPGKIRVRRSNESHLNFNTSQKREGSGSS